MKKILILLTALILLLFSCSAEDESVYFEMLAHGTDGLPARHRIFHTDGKGKYSVVYTFEDTPRPLTAIEDHYLYYAPGVGNEGQPTALHRVDLTTGEDIVINEMEYHHANQILAYGGELYILCDSFDSRDKCIYRVTQHNTVRCSGPVTIFFGWFIIAGDGCLYYFSEDDSTNSFSIMKVDLETFENSMILDNIDVGLYFGYADGRIYVQSYENDCYSISVRDGSKRLEAKEIVNAVIHDGRLYYTERLDSLEKGRPYGTPDHKLYAKNLKTGKIRVCGEIYINLFVFKLQDHLTFGKNGFIVTRPNAFSDQGWETLNQYYYYPYSGGEPVLLSLEETAAAS